MILAVRPAIGRLQISMAQLIITAVGPDRPGIVGELTAHLHAAGGNLLDSRMVNLRGEFAMMILLEAPDPAADKLARDLAALGQSMNPCLTAPPQTAAFKGSPGMPFKP